MSQELKISERLNKSIYVFKCFAIFSVICAHMPLQHECFAENIRNLFSTIGVGGFLLFAGYFMNFKESLKDFAVKKLKTILVPYLLFSGLTFALAVKIGNVKLNINDYLSWILGKGTWYYLVSILICCYIVFRIFKKTIFCIILSVLSIVSIVLTQLNIIKYSGFITEYLNIFNWFIFFAAGVLIRRYNILEKAVSLNTWKSIIIPTVTIVFGNTYLSYFEVSHFSITGLIFEFLGIWSLMIISYRIYMIKPLQHIGKSAYFIYLLHMQPADMLNSYLVTPEYAYIIKPLLILLIFYAAAFILSFTAHKLKADHFLKYIGITPLLS